MAGPKRKANRDIPVLDIKNLAVAYKIRSGEVEAVQNIEVLLSAVPIPDPTAEQKRVRLEGVVPRALTPPEGCRLNTRCLRRNLLLNPEICLMVPPGREVNPEHHIYCHIPLEELRKMSPVAGIREINHVV